MSHYEDSVTKADFESLLDRVKELESQVARMQDVKQCEDCLKLFNNYDYGEHKCHPVHANPWAKK